MDTTPKAPETTSEPVQQAPVINTENNQVNIDMLMDVPLTVTIELGRTAMSLKQALELQKGSVVELNRLAGDPIDVYVNERLIAKGEVVVEEDKFDVRITELITNNKAENAQEEAA